jgi:Ca2+-binding EF-hand superfamily protein
MHDFGPHSDNAYFQETFRAFDKNSDGFITAKEIKKTMKQLGERLSDKQAKEMIKAADSNHDGKLSQDEFRTLFNQITHFTTSSSTSSPIEHKSQ